MKRISCVWNFYNIIVSTLWYAQWTVIELVFVSANAMIFVFEIREKEFSLPGISFDVSATEQTTYALEPIHVYVETFQIRAFYMHRRVGRNQNRNEITNEFPVKFIQKSIASHLRSYSMSLFKKFKLNHSFVAHRLKLIWIHLFLHFKVFLTI